LVDWVSATFPRSAVEPAGGFLKALRRLFDGTVTTFVEGPGMHGYRYTMRSDVGGVIVAHGGNADTIFVQLPGDACARVACWPSLVEFIEHRAGHLTRCDLAFDDFAGTHTVDDAASMYLGGGFKMREGGRQPRASQAGNWLSPDGNGRTLYVGRSTNGKMARVYEKGKQLGDPTSPYVRWEVQFMNRDRELPLAMLLDPAPFLRAAYPALSFVHGDGCRIATRKAQERISVEKLSRHAREAYGPLVNVLTRLGGTADEIVQRLHRDALPKRLNAPTDAELIERCNALFADATEVSC
jgi:phage replication initiation protein